MKRPHAYIFLLLFLTSVSFTQEMPVPVEVQFQLFKKILSYDRNLRSRCGDTLAIAIVYQNRFRSSLTTKEEFLRIVDEQPEHRIENLPYICTAFEMGSMQELENFLVKNNIDIVYLTPLRGIDIKQVAHISHTNTVVTLTGIPEYISSGIIVGIDIKGEKPQILINLTSATTAKVDFNSQLLKLSKIVR